MLVDGRKFNERTEVGDTTLEVSVLHSAREFHGDGWWQCNTARAVAYSVASSQWRCRKACELYNNGRQQRGVISATIHDVAMLQAHDAAT